MYSGEKLLTREKFRSLTLESLGGKCAMCNEDAVDAHHILNRNLWSGDQMGGYYLSNGVPLCEKHHYAAELTLIDVGLLREVRGYPNEYTLPDGFTTAKEYDTWGNEVVAPQLRKPGPLFSDPGCQKALKAAGILWQFSGAF